MRCSIALAFVVAMIGEIQASENAEQSPSTKQFKISIRVLEGDPLGKWQNGTIKTLAEPCLITVEKHPFSFVAPGQIPVPNIADTPLPSIGRTIEGEVRSHRDGKIRLDITLSTTTFAEQTDDRLQFNSKSTRTITTIEPGELVKLRWNEGTAAKQTWAELSIEEPKP